MRDFLSLAIWIGIGLGLTAGVASWLERSRDSRSIEKMYDPSREARQAADPDSD
jgi:hypothetical protein